MFVSLNEGFFEVSAGNIKIVILNAFGLLYISDSNVIVFFPD